jgi:hypothetical protein
VQPKPVQRVFERTTRTDPERASRRGISNRNADRDNLIQSILLPSTLDKNYQIDVSFPSISSTSDITIEQIEAFLRFQGLPVQKSFNSMTNENFRRWTLQFKENDGK